MIGSSKICSKLPSSKQTSIKLLDVQEDTADFIELPGLGSDVGALKFVRSVVSGVQHWTLQYEHSASDPYTLIAESKSRAAIAAEDVATSDRFTVMVMATKGTYTSITDKMKKSSAHNLSMLEVYLQNQNNPSQNYLYKIFCVNQDEGFTDDMIVTVYSL
ncbi:two-component system histidine kinase [Vibrio phage vB_VpaS_1601]|nr:two-component system histidine kinase [Vibrio phage vB_VpaP_1601]